MGAWHTGPFDNDTALDFVSYLINWKNVKEVINKKTLNGYDYDQLRVSAQILIHLHQLNNLWTDQEIIDGMVKAFQQMLKDTNYFNSWRYKQDAATIKKQVKTFIKELKKLEGY